jgi:solute carrier family 35 protein E1
MITTMTQTPDTRTTAHRSLSPNDRANDASANERFPSFDDSPPNLHLSSGPVAESPVEFSPAQLPNLEIKWPASKTSQRLRDARNPRIYSHSRSRKSVSDALNNFRTRQGSVSENAQELAEALKAPVSYKLIVGSMPCED